MQIVRYVVVFDVSEAGTPLAVPFMAIAFVSVVIALAVFRLRENLAVRVIAAGMAALAVAAMLVVSIYLHHHTGVLQSAFRNGDYEVVEGLVEDFRPDSVLGNTPQTFRVGAQYFSMWTADLTPAFNKSVGGGGPALANKCVRILFVTDRYGTNEIIWLGVDAERGCVSRSTIVSEPKTG